MRFRALAIALLCAQDPPNVVYREIDAKLQGTKRAPAASEPDFLRRVTLDLVGVVPGVEEARAYLRKPDRASLVDRLLGSKEFNAWWARFILELTTDKRAVDFDAFEGAYYYRWLRKQLRKKRPYDAIVRDLIAASGNAEENPEVNFILRYNVRPSDIVGGLARAFLGNKLQCAQCHDHPFDTFTQEDFWGVAAFFSRTNRTVTDFMTEDEVNGVGNAADHEEGNPEKPPLVAKPRWLGKGTDKTETGTRKDLARFVTADPGFARNLVNQVWARLMGRGLVMPLDGFGGKAKPSHPELLDALAEHLRKSEYDLRALLRIIVTSQAYRRSSHAEGESDPRSFARAALRPLTVDQIHLSIIRATNYDPAPTSRTRSARIGPWTTGIPMPIWSPR